MMMMRLRLKFFVCGKKLLTRLRERERERDNKTQKKKEGEEMCVYFCVVVCVDDTNGKEVEKKKEGRNN